jgi:hypothetical protein
VAPTICESCGEPVVAGVQFCTNCGFFLDFGESSAEDTTAASRTSAPVHESARRSPTEPDIEAPADAMASTATGLRAVPDLPPNEVPTDIRTRRPSRTPAPSGVPCRRCSTPNPPTRRFCAKCGLFIGEPSGTDQLRAFTPSRQRWWQRWLHGRPGSERAARAEYRKSLPWHVRMRRVLIVLAALLLGFGYLHFVGRDPISWARHRLDALRGTLVSVPDVTATSPDGAADAPNYPAKGAVDGRSDTAWATPFSGPARITGSTCTASADTNGLLLAMPEQVTVRAIKIHIGFPDKNAKLRWRPKTLELWYPDGSCQRVNLADSPQPQQVRIHSIKTNAVRIAIVAGYSPEGGSKQPVTAITEIALLMRPK